MQLARSLPATWSGYDWRFLRWIGAFVLVAFWLFAPTGGFDAASYHAFNLERPYTHWNDLASFVYSPAAGQAIYPLTLLPLALFEKVLLAVNLVALVWLIGPAWGAVSLALLPVYSELLTGQIHLLLAVAIVVGMRHPSAWAFVLLTKVTPGIGLVWFGVRREWRKLGMALGATLLIVAVSAAIWPDAWVQWFGLLRDASERTVWNPLISTPLVIRLPLAAVLTGLAAWRNRPAALPFTILLALPAVWVHALVLLLAIPRLANRVGPD